MGGGDVTVMIRYVAQAGTSARAEAELEALVNVVIAEEEAACHGAREFVAGPPEIMFWRGLLG